MSDRVSPVKMIIIGFILVVVGVIVPLLMVLQLIEATFLLSFLSFAASVGGLFLGTIGAAYYMRDARKKGK